MYVVMLTKLRQDVKKYTEIYKKVKKHTKMYKSDI